MAAAGLAGAIALTGTTVAQAATASGADLRTASAAQSQVEARMALEVSRIDATFMQLGHQFNRFEIMMGRLAMIKGQCFSVRRLGITEARGHARLDQKLMVVAARERVGLPRTLLPAQRQLLADLARKSGTSFDRAWLRAQVVAHQHALVFVRQEAQRLQSREVKQLAREAIPVLQRHLVLVRAAQQACRL
ncbi:DUF4142 domain-containing protein [Allokutzneria albata]|uniref:DUF4142 domain-containing protein n=1 Tax=Allokutzneria albata TaxID=211114 RepID=UPI0004C440A8|nr:DUF4142 domain-containing protein [Allokutzneria albata]